MVNCPLFSKKFLILFLIISLLRNEKIESAIAPILDIEDESIGYFGTIGERNVLVDLKPHLQIKNIDAINSICSYHVFKPTNEEFPFTIDIKDKLTGEAVVEVIRRDLENMEEKKLKIHFLDCNKKKEYNFLIQAHDCSTPSLASNKVPVKIQVIDHDDYILKYEQEGVYKKTLIETDEIYENFLNVRAKDNDCTNDGYACSYKLLTKNLIDVEKLFPIKIDNTGSLSTLRSIKKGENLNFFVRAYDCLNNSSFVDAEVNINVIEKCIPKWTDFRSEISLESEKTKILENIKLVSCEKEDDNIILKEDPFCKIDLVNSKIVLNSDESVKISCKNNCDDENNSALNINYKSSKFILFSGNEKNDESIEYDDNTNDENKIFVSSNFLKSYDYQKKTPLNYITFSKSVENAQRIDFDGKFGNNFVLSAWIRRPINADKTIKEQVFCGTDSKSMNRHHFGLYFYRGNIKFLLRKESNIKNNVKEEETNNLDSTNIDSNEAFYPSLWEWSLYEPILSDSKWHFYEIKFNYPNVSLFIDGLRYSENSTNSDIIDAYELNDSRDTGAITTYVGACYHARTQSLTDHFEGDVGSINLTKLDIKINEEKKKCNPVCNEFINIDLSENNNFKQSNIKTNLNEITIETSNLKEISEILKNVYFYSKKPFTQAGLRSITVSTQIQCLNVDKYTNLNQINVSINLKQTKQEFKIQIEGDKQLFVTLTDLENGLEPFKDISINKILMNDLDSLEENSNENVPEMDSYQSAKLSKCEVRIIPDRNLISPSLNNEKVMFFQNLLDEYGFKFEETINKVSIFGLQTIENYENFIRHLTYVIININEAETNKIDFIKTKKFFISCLTADTNIETNTVLFQLNLAQNKSENSATILNNIPDFIANKQFQKYIVSENDDDIIQKRTEYLPLSSNKNASSPMILAILVMTSCGIGFLLVFGAIKIYTSKIIIQRRKALPNEENPQMEWDDSGLNITENPLEILENKDEILETTKSIEFLENEYTSSEGDDDEFNEDDSYSSEEEPQKIIDRELEWDDTSLQQLQQQQQISNGISNKSVPNFIDPNKFV